MNLEDHPGDVPHEESIEATEAEQLDEVLVAAREARELYESSLGLYEDLAFAVHMILDTCAQADNLTIHSITYRAKGPGSFERKAAKTLESDPLCPKYTDPIVEITDLAGVRVITHFLSTVDYFDAIVEKQFEVIERTEKSTDSDQLGYQSVHYLVKMLDSRTSLAEYSRFSGLVAEIQVRTILQHAWAEIEHDVQYKAENAVPQAIRRRFAALAGLIEIADREFQAIKEEDQQIRDVARQQVTSGQLDEVEVTGDALKTYLDKKFGPDGRMATFSYNFTARMLTDIGFRDLAEVDTCIEGYDDDLVSRAIYGSRQGQIQRFEDVLLAAMGDNFIQRSPYNLDWFVQASDKRIDFLIQSGITIGNCAPPHEPKRYVSAVELAAIRALTPK